MAHLQDEPLTLPQIIRLLHANSLLPPAALDNDWVDAEAKALRATLKAHHFKPRKMTSKEAADRKITHYLNRPRVWQVSKSAIRRWGLGGPKKSGRKTPGARIQC